MTQEWTKEKVDKLFETMMKKYLRERYLMEIAYALANISEIPQEDLTGISAQQIIDGIKDFMENGNVNDVSYQIFLMFLSKYPKSMIQRPVSRRLQILIESFYNGTRDSEGNPDKRDPVSMEELSQIFRRSKATISEAIKHSERLLEQTNE